MTDNKADGSVHRSDTAGLSHIAEYQKFVAEMAKAIDSAPFMNRDADHAAVVFEKLFETAALDVEILTHALDATVFGKPEIISAAKAFVERGGNIRVLHEADLANDHPFVEGVTSHGAGSLSILPLARQRKEDHQYNFAVVDAASYRFEPDRKVKEAIVRFNDPAAGANLHAIFAGMFEDSLRG
jgi:hypothetical protein